MAPLRSLKRGRSKSPNKPYSSSSSSSTHRYNYRSSKAQKCDGDTNQNSPTSAAASSSTSSFRGRHSRLSVPHGKKKEEPQKKGFSPPPQSNSSATDRQWRRRRRQSEESSSSSSSHRHRLRHLVRRDSSLSISSPFKGQPAVPKRIYFDRLPYLVQQFILDFLPTRDKFRLESVSRSWRRLLLATWRTTHELDIPRSIMQQFGGRRPRIDERHICGVLSRCGSHLHTIDAFMCVQPRVVDCVMNSVSQHCTKLRQLTLTTNISCEHMSTLLRAYGSQFPLLEALVINYQQENGDGIHNGLRVMSRGLPLLRVFRLHSYHLSPNVPALFPNSPELRLYSLVRYQPAIPTTDQSRWKYVSPRFLVDFLTYLCGIYPHLEALEFSLDTDYAVDEEAVARCLRLIGSTRPLKRLNLRIYFLFEEFDLWFGRTALSALASFTSLEELRLCAAVLPPDFSQMLRTSGLGGRLRSVRLQVVRQLSHDVLSEMFAALPNLQGFTLEYSPNDRLYAPRNITTRTIEHLLMSCPHLRILHLHNCDQVDLYELVPLFHRCLHTTYAPMGSAAEVVELVYKTDRRQWRMRHLEALQLCCVSVSKNIDDFIRVTLPRHCGRSTTGC